MRRTHILLAGILGIIILVLASFAILAWRPAIAAIDAPRSFEPALINRGAQLALIGNCNTCHTASGGRPYAGGRPMETPFGTVYATNITPDAETGIGDWSEAAFRRAMHEGVSRDGRHLYPAFPYDHFTKVSDDDISALYAFLMTRDSFRAESPPNDLSFPFNIRPLIAIWKLLFFEEGRFQPSAAHTADLNRGAYLVEGLAHCGACHTPRNTFGAERSDRSLGGGEVEGWHAPALNSESTTPVPWMDGQLFIYLRRGFVYPHGVAAGPMQPVTNNLAEAPEADVKAIASYVESILGPATAERRQHAEELLARLRREENSEPDGEVSSGTVGGPAPRVLSSEESIYRAACAVCHEPTKQQFSARGIDLRLSKVIALPEPSNLIRIILDGMEPPAGTPFALMPGFDGALTDEQVARLVVFLRRNYSDQPPWTDVDSEVRKVRQRAAKSRAQGGG